jgi:hypothetical protein
MKRYGDLDPGIVLEVPLAGLFAYICSIDGCTFWIYDFVSESATRTNDAFSPSAWKLPIVMTKYPPRTFAFVRRIPLTKQQLKVPPMWVRELDAVVQEDRLPTPFRAFSSERGNWHITEAETHQMFRKRAVDPDNLPRFIEQFLPEMRRIPAKTVGDLSEPLHMPVVCEVARDDLVTIEIRATPECKVHRDDVENELDEALQTAEMGEMIGAGGGELGDWDLAISVRECDLQKILCIIMRLLRRMKMPSDTKLVEQRADRDDVEHNLD